MLQGIVISKIVLAASVLTAMHLVVEDNPQLPHELSKEVAAFTISS